MAHESSVVQVLYTLEISLPSLLDQDQEPQEQLLYLRVLACAWRVNGRALINPLPARSGLWHRP